LDFIIEGLGVFDSLDFIWEKLGIFDSESLGIIWSFIKDILLIVRLIDTRVTLGHLGNSEKIVFIILEERGVFVSESLAIIWSFIKDLGNLID